MGYTTTIGIISIFVGYSIFLNKKSNNHTIQEDNICTKEYNQFMKSNKYVGLNKFYENKVDQHLKQYYLCIKDKIK